MEIINCPKCNSSISSETAMCPICGSSILKTEDQPINHITQESKKTNLLIYSPILGILLILAKCFATMSSQPSRLEASEIPPPSSLTTYYNDSIAVPVSSYTSTETDSALSIEKKYNSLNNDFRVFVVDKLDKKSKKEYSDIADHLDMENVKFEDFYREMLREQENSIPISDAQKDPYQAVVKANKIMLKLQQKYNISDEELRSIITLFLQNDNAKQLVSGS